MKAALGCQLAQQLHSTLGVDAAAAEGWVDVLSEGFAFRLLLVTERDAVMQGRAAQPGAKGVGWLVGACLIGWSRLATYASGQPVSVCTSYLAFDVAA